MSPSVPVAVNLMAVSAVPAVLAVLVVSAVALRNLFPRSSCRRVKQPGSAVSTTAPGVESGCGKVVHSTSCHLRRRRMTRMPAGTALPVGVVSVVIPPAAQPVIRQRN